ncbi:MAG TPA: lytic transglycosylase domain-containing protein, partial [bacterium]|nr:lytic transglycosylase domain-containing protein [bacterium]
MIAFFSLSVILEAQIPQRAYRYKRTLKREVEAVFGAGYPIAIFAAQIHQESLFDPLARSAYASGLGQQTPQTEKWLNNMSSELRAIAGGALNPYWSIRALVYYDNWLRIRTDPTGRYAPKANSCCVNNPDEWWARVLAAYNGGLGWVQKETLKAKQLYDCDTSCYFICTQLACSRAPLNCEES